jgi:CTP:molybdopterin cytidylyltransferase MocA
MSDVMILIPAAGASSRMLGRDKLLEMVDGRPQLARAATAALATGAKVWVTLAPGQTARAAILPSHPQLEVLHVHDAREGMAASLRAGAASAKVADGLMVLPADMPELNISDLQEVMKAFSYDPELPARGCSQDGKPGHPVILPNRLIARMAMLKGDEGARMLLEDEPITLVPLPGQRALTDLDTPEDWAAWRATRN